MVSVFTTALKNQYLQKLTDTNDFKQLKELFHDLVTKHDVLSHPEVAIMAYHILNKRQEHEYVAAYLEDIIKILPNPDLIIFCAFKSLDAGFLVRAKKMVTMLMTQGLEKLTEANLRNLCRAASGTGLHSEALKVFHYLEERKSVWATPWLKMRHEKAVDNLKKVEGIPVISLGENCLPWQLLNRWGLRYEPWQESYLTQFNLAATYTDACTKVVKKGDCLISQLEIISPEGRPLPYNRSLPFTFNHEVGDYWLDDDFKNLRDMYTSRLENFDRLLEGDRRLFVHYSQKGGNFGALADALYSVSRNDLYHLLIVDSSDGPVVTDSLQNASYLKLPIPKDDYVWFMPDQLESQHGVEYEEKIQHSVLVATRLLKMKKP